MKEIEVLLQQARNSGKNRYKSIEVLSTRIAEIIPDLLHTIENSTWSEAYNLTQVIRRVDNPIHAPLLIQLLDHKNVNVRCSAIYSLSNIKNQQSFDALYSRLAVKEGWYYFAKEQIIQALGNLGYSEAIQGLMQFLTDLLGDPSDPDSLAKLLECYQDDEEGLGIESALTQLISCVISLAKMGNHAMDHLAVALLRIGLKGQARFDIETIMNRTVYALKYVVCPGLLSSLFDAIRTPIAESNLLFEVLVLIGIRETIDELFQIIPSTPYIDIVFDKLTEMIGNIPGLDPFNRPDTKELTAWWQNKRQEFLPLTIYRFGKPVEITELIAKVLTPVFNPGHLFNDLQIITGQTFRFDPEYPVQYQNGVIKQLQEWDIKKSHEFEPGCLYRYGFKQDIKKVL